MQKAEPASLSPRLKDRISGSFVRSCTVQDCSLDYGHSAAGTHEARQSVPCFRRLMPPPGECGFSSVPRLHCHTVSSQPFGQMQIVVRSGGLSLRSKILQPCIQLTLEPSQAPTNISSSPGQARINFNRGSVILRFTSAEERTHALRTGDSLEYSGGPDHQPFLQLPEGRYLCMHCIIFLARCRWLPTLG